jgi:hypothetical protein
MEMADSKQEVLSSAGGTHPKVFFLPRLTKKKKKKKRKEIANKKRIPSRRRKKRLLTLHPSATCKITGFELPIKKRFRESWVLVFDVRWWVLLLGASGVHSERERERDATFDVVLAFVFFAWLFPSFLVLSHAVLCLSALWPSVAASLFLASLVLQVPLELHSNFSPNPNLCLWFSQHTKRA